MTQQEANTQSISVCAAFLIAFIGMAHEVVGPTLFPWAPGWFGPILWHAIGIAAIVLGLSCLGGVLRIFKFPIVPCGILLGFGGIAAMTLMVVMHQEFHYFAMWLAIAGFTLATSQRKAARLQQT
jgi:hypothetical protein